MQDKTPPENPSASSDNASTEDAPKKRGRAPTPDPTLHFQGLQWPKTQPRSEFRRRGNYHLQSTEKSKKPALDSAKESFRTLIKRMRCENALITWDAQKSEDIVNASFKDPGVAVYFQKNGIPHVIACDRYQTILANFRAVIERTGAIYVLLRNEDLANVISIIEQYHKGSELEKEREKAKDQTSLIVVDFQQEEDTSLQNLPSKGSMNFEDWIQVLEVEDDHIEEVVYKSKQIKMPKELRYVRRAYKRLSFLYHPDTNEHITDGGLSHTVISTSYHFIANLFKDYEKTEAEYSDELNRSAALSLEHHKQKIAEKRAKAEAEKEQKPESVAEIPEPEAAIEPETKPEPISEPVKADLDTERYAQVLGLYPKGTSFEVIAADEEKRLQKLADDIKAEMLKIDSIDEEQDEEKEEPDLKEMDFEQKPSISSTGFDDTQEDDDESEDTDDDNLDLIDNSVNSDEDEASVVSDNDSGYDQL